MKIPNYMHISTHRHASKETKEKGETLPQRILGRGYCGYPPQNPQLLRLRKLANNRKRSIDVEEKVGGRS